MRAHVGGGEASAQELGRFLCDRGRLDLSKWGRGGAKTVEDLLEEVRAGETTLTEGGPGGGVARSVSVLSIRVSREDGAVLTEARQRFPDGRERRREDTYVAEKLLPGEAWQDGVRRGVQEELGSAVPDGQSLEVDVDAASYARSETSRVSSSYPGLMSHYVCHEVAARVRPLPQEDFETREPRPGGFLVTSWAWKRPGPRRRGPPRPPRVVG